VGARRRCRDLRRRRRDPRAPPTAGGWDVSIALIEHGVARDPVRRIASEANDCRRLDGSIALVVALLVRPSDRPIHPPLAPEPGTEPEPATAATSAPVHALLGIGTAVGFGVIGDVAVGGRIGVAIGLGGDDFALRVGATLFPSRTVSAAPGGAEIDGWLASLGITGRLFRDRWAWVEVGGTIDAGMTRATGRDVSMPLTAIDPLVIATASASTTFWPHEVLGIRLEGALAFPIVGTQWVIESGSASDEVASMSPASGMIALEAVVRASL
jgi:hypothetical protein